MVREHQGFCARLPVEVLWSWWCCCLYRANIANGTSDRAGASTKFGTSHSKFPATTGNTWATSRSWVKIQGENGHVHRDAKKEWEYYHAIQTKLRDKIQATVAKQKAARLRANLPVRTWLKDLKASSAPPEATTKRSISVEYHRLMNIGFTEWPTGGPGAWLAIWENLICWAERFDVTLENWLNDVSLVWQRVPGVAGYFDEVERKVVQGKHYKYSPTDISAAIQQYWERRREGTILKFVKPKATRSAFTTGVTFDSEEASDIGDSAVVPTTIIYVPASKQKWGRAPA